MSSLERPRVAIVTRHWGEDSDEETFATRSVAGALARVADVEIIHLVAPPEEARIEADSVFRVHHVALRGARALRASLLRAALGAYDRTRVPAPVATVLERYEGRAPDVPDILSAIAPDALVLAGLHQPYDREVLGIAGRRSFRLCVLPFCADPHRLAEPGVASLLDAADVVGALHPGELAALRETGAPHAQPLDVGLALNRSATVDRLFGVRFFGRYVLVLRRFPLTAQRYARAVTHEVLRDVLGGRVSVAEIDGEHWRVADRENTVNLPVNPSRVNLWRLMAHAEFTVDLRPPGVLGREALESMLLHTPVIAPEDSAAMAHVAAANGGLWYRDAGELLDAARVLMDRSLRAHLADQAAEYALAHHGEMDDFIARAARLVLGAPAAAPAA